MTRKFGSRYVDRCKSSHDSDPSGLKTRDREQWRDEKRSAESTKWTGHMKQTSRIHARRERSEADKRSSRVAGSRNLGGFFSGRKGAMPPPHHVVPACGGLVLSFPQLLLVVILSTLLGQPSSGLQLGCNRCNNFLFQLSHEVQVGVISGGLAEPACTCI